MKMRNISVFCFLLPLVSLFGQTATITYQLPNPNRSINTSYAVGTIAGEASVSPTGSAIYQIPIIVMPGMGGVQPIYFHNLQ